LIRRLAVLLVLVLLPVSGAFAEKATETEGILKEKGLPQVNPAAFFSLYFATSHLPEGSEPAERSLRIDRLYPETSVAGEDGKEPEPEKVTAASVSWKKGGYYLIKAIKVAVDDEGAEISLDPEKMKWTGDTTVTLVLESEHYRYETEQTLTVADADKATLFTQTVFNPVFNITTGTSFTAQDLLGNIVSVTYPAYCQANGFPYPDAEVQVEEAETPGLTRDEDTGILTLENYGVFDLNLDLRIANLRWKLPFRIEAEPYSINGPGFVMPGTTARYRVTDLDAAAGRRYTWSVEGDGVTIDPKDGTLTVPSDVKTDTYIRVVLTPDTDPAINTSVLVPEGVLPKNLYVMHEPETPKETEEESAEKEPVPLTEKEAGFEVAVPEGDNWRTGVSEKRQDGWIFRCVANGTGGATVAVDARTDPITTGFREDDLAAMSFYNENVFPDTVKNLQSRDIRIDGHLAKEYLFTVTDQNGQATHYGQISYCRNNQALTARVFTTRQGATADTLVPVTMKDLDRIAAGIHYRADENTIVREDAQLTVTTKDDAAYVFAGKTLSLSAEFANTELINKSKKNNGITWQIRDASTGEETAAASVNAANVLSVARDLDKVIQLEITAVSDTFGTKASCMILACPMVTELSVEPAEIYWFKGIEKQPVTLKAKIRPEGIPLELLSWIPFNGKTLEVLAGDDGTAIVTGTGDANNSVKVAAPDGTSKVVPVKTVTAVESVELKRSGKPEPGGKVSYSVLFFPARGIADTVKWSLNVGEDIAQINEKGAVLISPDAAPGTVIRVTCRAIGAPEPIIATDEITVE
jgi:hypothetical protein